MKTLWTSALIIAGLLCATSVLQAQYSLDWYTINGGGGTSSGGGYTLSGTIGQSDANPAVLSGGSYSLEGGFWPGLIAPSTSGGPTLFIQLAGASIIVSWLPVMPGFALQQTDGLLSPVWTPGPAGNPTTPIPASSVTRYYRLIKP
jgi:hypothetical protein